MGKNIKIGIVGQGFVGSAIREGLKDYYKVYTYDLDPVLSSCDSLEAVIKISDIIFVCLPTPMKKNGVCDTSIVKGVISEINEICRSNGFADKIAVIKSTVPPGTTSALNSDHRHISIVFSPEFLTEANSFNDFKNQTRIIVGGSDGQSCRHDKNHETSPVSGNAARKVKQMFRKPFPDIPIVVTKSETAEMVKYFTNCFLASKVIFANQMYEICTATGIDYDKVSEYALYDDRIGKSHLSVPGPDGDLGFGGHCFPKDLSAIISYARQSKLYPNFLLAVQETNEIYRTDRDWENMKGRAVSED